MQFLVRVRIDRTRLPELGRQLASGALDVAAVKWTFCLEHDLTVGVSLWDAADRDDLERKLAPHRPYYAEVLEIASVVTSADAKRRLLAEAAMQGA